MSSALLPRLQSLIRAEAKQRRYELRSLWSLPLPERVAHGYAIEGLDVTSICGNRKHQLWVTIKYP
jgi:hypothetical protein